MKLKRTGLKLLSVALCFGMLSACQKKEELKLSDEFAAYQEEKKAIELEFGEEFLVDPSDYLSEETSDDLLGKVEAKIHSVDDEGNMSDEAVSSSNLKVGNYMIVLTAEDMHVEIPLKVMDTTAPEFVDFKETMEYEEGSEAVDFKELFDAEDHSEVTIEVNGDVDFTVPGEYMLSITAMDEYGNKNERTCKVTITKKPEEPKPTAPSQNTSTGNQSSNQNPAPSGNSGNTSTSGNNENTSTPPAQQPSVTLSGQAAEVLTLVNQQRAAAGLAPLAVDADLKAASQIRAKEIERSFSHTRPDGSDCFSAISNRYSFLALGENIAGGQNSAASVMNAWMGSDGHRANILNAKYTHIGIACYQAADGTLYWVQVFGQK